MTRRRRESRRGSKGVLALARLAALATAVIVATAATAATSPVPLGRLPDTIHPTAYRLELTVDPAATDFSGHAEIDAVLRQPARAIYLHGRDLRVTSATVAMGSTSIGALYTQVDPTGVARLDFPRTLPAGPLTLIFDYTAPFRRRDEGLFHARVGADWYAWTQFEPIDARRMFPGFDEPGFKTPFTLTVRAPSGARVFANTAQVASSRAGRWIVHRFAPTKPLPTYLVSIAVGPFDVLATNVPPNAVRHAPLPFRVIATKGELPRMRFAAEQAPRLLALLERYFDIPYPYAKLDFIASPLEEGAMENAALILFNDSEILLDANAPLAQLRDFADTSAHEMAHQWVGDLVTPTWWTDLWLNESFAEWLGDKIAGQWRPDLDFSAGELADALGAMQVDSLGRGRAVRQPITDSRDIASAFDDITYSKGAQVLSMFETYLGPERFASALRLHLERFRFGNATAQDFFDSLTQASGDRQIAAAMRTFIDQTGVPIVTVDQRPGSLRLMQSRYVPLGVSGEPPRSWLIPVCLARGGARECTLLATLQAAVPELRGDAPLMPNAGGTGYYRFRFAGRGWAPLLAAAPTLDGREALAVADSVWADFASGTGSFARVIEAARTLSENADYLAAVALARHLRGLADSMLSGEQRAEYRSLMESIYAPRLADLGLDPRTGAYDGEPAPRQSLRQALLPVVALQARNADVRARLAAAAQSYLAGDDRALDPAFRGTALAVAVQDLGAPFMSRLAAVATRSSDPLLADQAASAIGTADTPALAQQAIDLAASGRVPQLDAIGVLMALSRRPGVRDAAVHYADQHFSELVASVPGFERPELAELFAGYCSPAGAERAEAFVRPRMKALGGGQLELARVKEQIIRCAQLKSAKEREIDAALQRFAPPSLREAERE
ncbi:MAG TPA: M1 family metallopeptidase [Steroidobacteraceae bacterium]|nr:M1 family metallopeptidase [Steroidobacteraceae bacterium]